MKAQGIIAALPKLNQTELTAIRDLADQLLSDRIDAADETSPLYAAMTRLIGVRLSYREFHKRDAYKTWRKTAPHVVSFIEKTFPTAGRIAKSAIMTFLLETLLDDLKSRRVPISLSRVVSDLERLPLVFDQSFPDYIKSGNAHLILEAMLSQKRSE